MNIVLLSQYTNWGQLSAEFQSVIAEELGIVDGDVADFLRQVGELGPEFLDETYINCRFARLDDGEEKMVQVVVLKRQAVEDDGPIPTLDELTEEMARVTGMKDNEDKIAASFSNVTVEPVQFVSFRDFFDTSKLTAPSGVVLH